VINDSAVAKDKLSGLTEITSEAIINMTDTQLLSYVQALNVTTASFPLQKDQLVEAFNEKDYATVFQWLQVISSSLSQMHADKLAGECEKHIKLNEDLSNVRHVRVKVFLDYFVPTLDLFVTDVHNVLEDLDALDDVDTTKQDGIDTKVIIEKILTLSDLDADFIKQIHEDELADYVKILNGFEAEFQTQQSGLKGAIKIKHYAFVIQWLTAIEQTLTKLHATQLLSDCKDQIAINKDFNNIHHEKLEYFINYLLSSMSMLSSDIKALKLPKDMTKKPSEIPGGPEEHISVDVELLAPGSSPDAKTILIINKMTMFMNSFKNALGDKGHRLIGVTNAESAIGYLKTAKPDMFIIDEDLPGTDCYVLIKIIRATGQLAPILFTASKIKKDKMVKYMEAGVAEFIMKPITPADVQKKVLKHIH